MKQQSDKKIDDDYICYICNKPSQAQVLGDDDCRYELIECKKCNTKWTRLVKKVKSDAY
jgi:DNA-directed RNA polymerase subunit RPC12/RpoP